VPVDFFNFYLLQFINTKIFVSDFRVVDFKLADFGLGDELVESLILFDKKAHVKLSLESGLCTCKAYNFGLPRAQSIQHFLLVGDDDRDFVNLTICNAALVSNNRTTLISPC